MIELLTACEACGYAWRRIVGERKCVRIPKFPNLSDDDFSSLRAKTRFDPLQSNTATLAHCL